METLGLHTILRSILLTDAEVHVEPDRRRAIERALELADPGDVVLVAGKGHESTQEVRGEKLAFDDRTVVKEVISCPT